MHLLLLVLSLSLFFPWSYGFGPSPPPQRAGTLAWKLSLPGWIDASPTLPPDGNMIYVSSIEKLYALDAHTQAIVWTFASCKPITSKVVVSTDGETVYAYVCWNVPGAELYATGVIALQANTGRELWRTKGISGDIVDGVSPFLNSHDPDNGILYFTAGKNRRDMRVVACNTTTGAFIWQWVKSKVSYAIIYTAEEVTSTNLIYVAYNKCELSAINASTGHTVRTVTWDGKSCVANVYINSPLLSHDQQRIYQNWNNDFTRKNEKFPSIVGVSTALDNVSAPFYKESYYAGDVISNTPVLSSDDARMFFGSLSGNVFCVDATAVSPPNVSPEANNATVWIFPTESSVQAAGILDEGEQVFYIGSLDTIFYAVNASTGSLVWSFKTGGEIHSNPVLSADGKYIFFGSRDNHIYAISTGK